MQSVKFWNTYSGAPLAGSWENNTIECVCMRSNVLVMAILWKWHLQVLREARILISLFICENTVPWIVGSRVGGDNDKYGKRLNTLAQLQAHDFLGHF